jgi:LysM repeat protein
MKIKDIVLEAKPHPRGPATKRIERLIREIESGKRKGIDWNSGSDYTARATVTSLLIKTFKFNMGYWLYTKYPPSKGSIHNKAFRGCLAAWQSMAGLTADGIIGLETLRTIKRMLDGGFSSGVSWTNQQVSKRIAAQRKNYGVPQIVCDMAQAVENGDLTHFHSVYNCYYDPSLEVGQGIFQIQGNNWKEVKAGGYAKGVSGTPHDLANFHVDNQVKIGLSSLSRSYKEAIKDKGGDASKVKVSDVLKYHNSKSWASAKVSNAGLLNKFVTPTKKQNDKVKQDDYHLYAVQAGDTLYKISKEFDVSIDNIKQANNLSSNNIQVGQELNIPIDNKKLPPKLVTPKTKTNTVQAKPKEKPGMFSRIGKAITGYFQ